MEQVQATPDGAAKRRATRPQHAFHNDDTICGPPQTGAPAPASDALSVRQGMPSEGGKQLWEVRSTREIVAGLPPKRMLEPSCSARSRCAGEENRTNTCDDRSGSGATRCAWGVTAAWRAAWHVV